MRTRKDDRDSEQKGSNTGLIRKPVYVHRSAADDYEVWFEREFEWHRDILSVFRYKPVEVWPDEALLAFRWLTLNREMTLTLRLATEKRLDLDL